MRGFEHHYTKLKKGEDAGLFSFISVAVGVAVTYSSWHWSFCLSFLGGNMVSIFNEVYRD